MVHWHVNLSCVPHCFFPAKCVFSAFFKYFSKPVPLGLGEVKRDLSLCHGTSHIPTMEAIPCAMAQSLYHDGACTCSTCANLCQKVSLQGRVTFHSVYFELSTVSKRETMKGVDLYSPLQSFPGVYFDLREKNCNTSQYAKKSIRSIAIFSQMKKTDLNGSTVVLVSFPLFW